MAEYTEHFHLHLKPKEVKLIKSRMEEAGIRKMGAYIRKMAIDGFVINLDLSDVKELVRLLRYCSNNLNQYAKKANETGSIYKADIEDIKRRQERLWSMAADIMTRLSAIL